MDQDSADLPPEIADRFTRPFVRFLKIKAAAGGMLFLATFAALILSNSAWSQPFLAFWETPVGLHFGSLDLTRSLRHWINDGLMTLFFFAVALELKRELVLGELRILRVAALSFAGALGGMLVP
ncbi:MAG: Na+/H+ antiporter NhaA, partial [Alphaproteobacteria bacterium]|nr:Na+/H+ antiporter NhaA [Alphaproteobacteria bacterium]